jgi:hypothetical protein
VCHQQGKGALQVIVYSYYTLQRKIVYAIHNKRYDVVVKQNNLVSKWVEEDLLFLLKLYQR